MLAPICIGANDSVQMVAIAKNLFNMVADAGWSTGGSPCFLMKELGACLLDLGCEIVIFPNTEASWYVTLEMKRR